MILTEMITIPDFVKGIFNFNANDNNGNAIFSSSGIVVILRIIHMNI